MAVTLPSLAVANESAEHARQVRADWLFSLQDGVVSMFDIITQACEPDGRPLLRIGLVRLLEHQDGWSRHAAITTINQTLRLLSLPELSARGAAKLTVQWLVDARSGGRRQLAFADAMDSKTQLPWPGFPYSPQQEGATA
ncbi:hypothetical protein [Microbacterium gorillae]|uniref:hypothetical protein n=1 Tax=Microbacterium gorillae TaxID=1231063 RepID=UPI003D95A2AE